MKPRQKGSGLRSFVRWVAALSLPLAALVSCSAVLGNASYKCTSTDPSACPAGQTCDVASGLCVDQAVTSCASGCPVNQVCDPGTQMCAPGMVVTQTDGSMIVVVTHDAMTDAPNPREASMGDDDTDAHVQSDAPFEAATNDSALPPVHIGNSCSSDSGCASDLFCATAAIIGSEFLGGGSSFCTRSCCTSEDCGDGAACVATGLGGTYCAPAAAVSAVRSVPSTGGKTGGAPCTLGSDCHSGICGSSTLKCIDTCCSNAQCGSGVACSVRGLPEGHVAYVCETASGIADGQMCGTSSNCVSNECTTYSSTSTDAVCRHRCCNFASCNTPGGTSSFCSTEQPGGADGSDYVNNCYQRGEPGYSSRRNIGTGCSLDTDCKTGICDTPVGGGTLECVDNCCVDTDCPSGEVCRARPSTGANTAALLRCTMP